MQMRSLRRKCEHLRKVQLVYVITDVADSNIANLVRKQELQEWKQEGKLDFARFDCECDSSLKLVYSHVEISVDKPAVNPLMCIANYLWDSLKADGFRSCKGELQVMSGCIA